MSRPSPSRGPAAQGLTTQQIAVLIIVALLGLAVLVMVGTLLLGGPSTAAAPGPATLTPLPTLITPAASTQTPPAAFQLPAGCTQIHASGVLGQVTRVIDGSTLEVQVSGSLQKIGFAGIEVLPSAGLEALAPYNLVGQAVTLVKDTSEQDDSGRTLRYVFFAGQFLNLELVRQGAATAQANGPDRACQALFVQAQQQAKADRLGLWQLTPAATHTFMPLVSLVPATQVAGCDCSSRPTCDEFTTHAAAQACYNACQDYNTKLDDNHNGIACENLP